MRVRSEGLSLIQVIIVTFAILCLNSRPAIATSVLAQNLDQVFHGSIVVFEGEVVGRDLQLDPASRLPVTVVSLRVLEVIKGAHPGRFVELRYLGGNTGDVHIRVDGSMLPAVGERGIYFVESLTGKRVNPLAGWSQGHYRVRTDANGVNRVLTEEGQPVTTIRPVPSASAPGLSSGAAQGLVVDPAGHTTEAITVDAFKRRLREIGAVP